MRAPACGGVQGLASALALLEAPIHQGPLGREIEFVSHAPPFRVGSCMNLNPIVCLRQGGKIEYV